MRRVAAPLALLTATVIARAHDPDFTSAQMETLRAAAARVRTALERGGVTAEDAWVVDFAGFTAHDLDHVPETLDVPAEVREALRRVCGTTLYRRGPVGRLEGARDICYLLASPESKDWLKAFRLLRREPLTGDIDRAVIALGRDEAPLIRLIASKLATSLIVFGRDAEGLRATVLACLTDADPNVAAACALREAVKTRDKRVIDRMVACLGDHRALDPKCPPPLWLGQSERVSDVVARRLCGLFYSERHARWRASPPFKERPEHVALMPDEIRAWWKENRGAFGFETPAPQWRCVLDRVLVLDVGKPVVVEAEGGIPIKVALKEYREHWLDGEPVTTIEADIHAVEDGEDGYMGTVGNPDHYDGFVSSTRGNWSVGMAPCEVTCRAAFLPTNTKGRVRMKLTIHFGHEQGD
jgi:hypothetical protein